MLYLCKITCKFFNFLFYILLHILNYNHVEIRRIKDNPKPGDKNKQPNKDEEEICQAEQRPQNSDGG